MKKEMLKKLKAVMLSVFMLGVVMFQCADALPVMAADKDYKTVKTLHDLNTYLGLSGDNAITDNDVVYGGITNNFLYVFAVRTDPDYADTDVYFNASPGYSKMILTAHFSEPQKVYGIKILEYYGTRDSFVTGTVDSPWKKSSFRGTVGVETYDFVYSFSGSVPIPYFCTARKYVDGIAKGTGYTGVLGNNIYSFSDDELGLGFFGSSGASSGSYDDSLGYLKNVKCTALVVNDKVQDGNSPNEYAGDKKYKLSYSYTTTSGYDLRADGADVEFLVKIKGGYTTLTGKYHSLPTALSDSYKAGNGKNYFYIGGDSNVSLNELFGQFRNEASLFAKTIDSTIYVYMRPVSNGKYGGWTRCKFDNGVISGTKNMEVDTGTTKDGTITKENDGEDDGLIIDSSSSSSVASGSGKDFNDAESNATVKPSDGSQITGDINTLDILEIFKSFRSWLSEFVGSFGEFPSLIAKTFPFLPAVITSGISIGFAVSIVLRILGR